MLLPGESLPSTYAAAKRVLLAGRLAPAPGLPPLSTLLAALSPLQLAGAAVFLFANLLQLDSHLLLAQLAAHPRRGSGSSSAATGPQSSTTAAAGAAAGTYSIPHGRGFELVSCPHYLAEILVYVGLVLLERGGGLAHWLMLAWVVSEWRCGGVGWGGWRRRGVWGGAAPPSDWCWPGWRVAHWQGQGGYAGGRVGGWLAGDGGEGSEACLPYVCRSGLGSERHCEGAVGGQLERA